MPSRSHHPPRSACAPTQATAVVLREPHALGLERIELQPAGDDDVVVELEWSGISTGTERLLWAGDMPPFPGLGYPLVPGYESVGLVRSAGASSGRAVGERVFVPGASCFKSVRGLFGGAASHLVVAGSRALPVDPGLEERAVLLALAATAQHALAAQDARPPELIVGHGVLGRLLARIAVAKGHEPTVWESNASRRDGASGYRVVDPDDDERRDYGAIYDASGDASLVDALIARLAPGGALTLAGFYSEPVRFDFPPAFMREARLRIAAEWKPEDLVAAEALVRSGALSLDDLISHRRPVTDAADAYRRAFEDPRCLKMILDWRESA